MSASHSTSVAMRRIGLPAQVYEAGFVDRACVVVMHDPSAASAPPKDPAAGGWSAGAWSLDGLELWRQVAPPASRTTRPRLGLDDSGQVWMSCGHLLFRPGSDEAIDVAAGIVGFTCTRDGFLLALETDPLSIARLRLGGEVVWRTELTPPDEIGHRGIVQMEKSTGFRPRQKPPWRPRTWDMRLVLDPIVVGARLAIVGAGDYESGLSCRYALALDTGEVAWRTDPAPWTHVFSIGGDWFLGQQGYGTFNLRRVMDDGTTVDTWPSDGYVRLLPCDAIHVIELENMLPSRTHASALIAGGVVKRGPHLEGYYTSRPALTATGDLIFWRNDELQVVDARLERRTLARVPSREGDFPSDMHLDDLGTLAFTLGNGLWTTETRFRPWIDD